MESLLREYKVLNNRLNEILITHKAIADNLGKLPESALKEFSDLNKKMFLINEELIEELKKKNKEQ